MRVEGERGRGRVTLDPLLNLIQSHSLTLSPSHSPPSMTTPTPSQVALIESSLSSDQPILKFGSFLLKSGRTSPYFFNFGLFNTGHLLLTLATAFADQILDEFPQLGQDDGISPQVLFGPAYKGIPLVAAVSTELARRGHPIGYAYNRKEIKDHGEGGRMVGTPLKGQRILILDDVVTSGKAIGEATALAREEGALVVAIYVALDREEKGKGSLSTVEEVQNELGLTIRSTLSFRNIISWLQSQPDKQHILDSMIEYRKQYGI